MRPTRLGMPKRAKMAGMPAICTATGSTCSLLRKRDRRLSRCSNSCLAAGWRTKGTGYVWASRVRHSVRFISSAPINSARLAACVGSRKGQSALTTGKSCA